MSEKRKGVIVCAGMERDREVVGGCCCASYKHVDDEQRMNESVSDVRPTRKESRFPVRVWVVYASDCGVENGSHLNTARTKLLCAPRCHSPRRLGDVDMGMHWRGRRLNVDQHGLYAGEQNGECHRHQTDSYSSVVLHGLDDLPLLRGRKDYQ